MMQRFVAYYRVSTKYQGASGLGLEAQRAAVSDYLQRIDGDLLSGYTEVESGKKTDRPELLKALKEAKRKKAVLIVAKLDRLARNLSFICLLRDAGVAFRACDMPDANEFMINIMASLAEYERKLISERTKAALAVKKAQGVQLGNIENLRASWTDTARKNKQSAQERAERWRPIIEGIQTAEMSLRQLADCLNEKGYRTKSGGMFYPMQVKRLLSRL